MAVDHRIVDSGNPVPFSCENKKFRTDTRYGFAHTPHVSRGSVVAEHLLEADEGLTLWLEHVEQKSDPDARWFWLMWYDEEGKPKMPMSAVFDEHQLGNMIEQLVRAAAQIGAVS